MLVVDSITSPLRLRDYANEAALEQTIDRRYLIKRTVQLLYRLLEEHGILVRNVTMDMID